MNYIGNEFITAGGNRFIVVGEWGRLYTVETDDGRQITVPKKHFSMLVQVGHYREIV